MKKEEVQSIAFQLISAAGEAYDCFYKALKSAKEQEYSQAEKFIDEGNEKLANAHRVQTDFLVAEARGDDIDYSVVMMHAQDSLMTTILYERIIVEQIDMYKRFQASQA